MSQEKSDGMSPTELVENWMKWLNRMQALKNETPNPSQDRIFISGSIKGIDACIEGLALEIKRSNYVSGKEITQSDLKSLIDDILGIYRVQNDILVKELLSKYRIIER